MKIKFPDSMQLTHADTPLWPVKRFFSDSADCRVWIKRDDMTGIELSGNKVRKLDFLIAEALDQNAGRIITCGGVQSNHCRAAAFMARKMGLECTLFLRGEPEIPATGNLLLDHLAGVDIQYVTSEEYQNIDNMMAEYATEITQSESTCYVIPEGGSNATGAWGYVACFQEIAEQLNRFHMHIDAVIVATGSGGTHAGLLIGKKLLESKIDIISINVCDNAGFFKQKIKRITEEFASKYQVQIDIAADEVNIIDGFVGDGYGLMYPEIVEVIYKFARTEGIILDPVYSAKAFHGFTSMIENHEFSGKNILFIHTGGIFGVFPQNTHLQNLRGPVTGV